MNRAMILCAAAVALMMPVLALAQPVITNITPTITSANSGATVDIYGTGFGSLSDIVYFPDYTGGHNVNPIAVISGGVRVRVPPTWSGDVFIRANGVGGLSNGINHDITFSWSGQKWFSWPFTWYLNNNAAPGCTFNDTRDRLIDGYNAWSCASGIDMSFGGSTSIATTANDGTNCRYWSSSGWGSGTIAVATWWYNTSTGEIVESDIAFNSQHFSWSCTGEAGDMDVGNIGTHEEGHTIGLLDLYGATNDQSTMYGFGANGETIRRTLHTHDALGAEFMYPHTRANFTYTTPSGWYSPLVPRNTADASDGYAPLPGVLNGNTTLYVNAASINNGGDCAAPSGLNHVFLDDNFSWWNSWHGVFGVGVTVSWHNMNHFIRGGRHTLRYDMDVNEETLESSEFDNSYTTQYVFSPYVLANQTPVSRATPPVRGSLTYPNCDGFEASAGGSWWACVGILPVNSSDDNDLRMHDEVPTSTNGFDNYVASSIAIGSASDFVLVNGNNHADGANATVWVGVNRWSGGNDNAYVQLSENLGTLYAPLEETYTIDANDIVNMHEVRLDDTITSNWQIRLDNLSGSADLGIAIYDAAGSYYAKSSYGGNANGNGPGGDESFVYAAPATGWYGIVVYKTDSDDLGDANTYTLRVRETPPNLRPDFADGWDYPVVPRNDTGADVNNAQVTATLDGNTPNTYYNLTGINDGPNPAPQNHTRLYVDDVYRQGINWGNILAGQRYAAVNWGPLTIRGGRHTMRWDNDWDDAVEELDETDNVYARQFVWSPEVLITEAPETRPAPPDRGSGIYPNNDGFAYTGPSGYAWVTALCPDDPDDDYDVLVYSDYVGAESGFSELFSWSYMLHGDTEYSGGVFTTGGTTYYPAAVFFDGGDAGFTIDAANSDGKISSSFPAIWPGETLPGNRLIDVFECLLGAGTNYVMTMTNNSGGADLNVRAHAPSVDNDAFGIGTAEFVWETGGPGADEGGVFTPSEDGWYVFVVYKDNYDDVADNANYDFTVALAGDVAVGDEALLPTAFALLPNTPNPFNPMTTIRYEVPGSGSMVRLEVYDLTGRRVRTLVDESRPAGRYEVTWNGTDDNGARVASGTYFYRLQAGSFTRTEKMTLVK